ncbi:hypothetical protein SAMN04488068_2146 [Hydrocarboniphaga daqingensis]|jgi:hypothetical protein|uniref:Uncharacterized protein n=1 Tax=Hydrocarboniphaga daqingensis TaxID=490188 RepID=A0A1M5PBP9_9GAMM|nr:hypothetical protein [Hydrocarboniphaga daqingensis]SHG99208.1 hypothetical protein SAMN04488068_2146 [Hydrocarboniphaga daqingensis]
MTRRSSPNDLASLDDLSALDALVVDKRRGQRSHAKKNRRNRHYQRQFLRSAGTLAALDGDDANLDVDDADAVDD